MSQSIKLKTSPSKCNVTFDAELNLQLLKLTKVPFSILTEEDVFCPECGTPVKQKLETENSSSGSLSAKQEEV